jgi:hypothetical protein
MPFDRDYPRDDYGQRPTAPPPLPLRPTAPEPLPLRPTEAAPEPLWLRCGIAVIIFAVAVVLLRVVWRIVRHL